MPANAHCCNNLLPNGLYEILKFIILLDRYVELQKEVCWIKAGCQRAAVVQALYKPQIASDILRKALPLAPRLLLRDVWFVLNELQGKSLAYRLTPRLVTGTVYFLTEKGRASVAKGFGKEMEKPDGEVDWQHYALVARATTRRALLLALLNVMSANDLRKSGPGSPVNTDMALKALREMAELRLVSFTPDSENKNRKLYVLTRMGLRIARELQR